MTEINLTIKPRPPFRDYLNRTQRYACIVAHRRAGKTVAVIQDLIAKAVQCDKREPRFAYIAPTYTQAKDVAWSYIKEYTAAIPGMKVSESELSVTFPHNQARIRLYGAENYDRMRGLYFDGAAIDETGDQDPRVYPEVVRPALSDRKGWVTFIGTPKGRNAFHGIYEQSRVESGWFSASLPASATKLIDDEELADAAKQLTPEQYAQEYECSFEAAIVGAYYGKDMSQADADGRICPVPHDKSAAVEAWWDLGIDDAMSIWIAQRVGREIHLIDYYENSGYGLDHYVDWIKDRPFRVDEHLWPHDAEARELQTGNSRRSFLEGRGLRGRIVAQHRVEDRINSVRMNLNRCWFNSRSGGVKHGLDCLRMYRAEEKLKHGVLKTSPLHDWASHGADAFGIGIMGTKRPPAKVKPHKPIQRV